MTEIELWQEWTYHPLTEKFIDFVKENRQEKAELQPMYDTIDHTVQWSNYQKGYVSAIDDLLEWIKERRHQ